MKNLSHMKKIGKIKKTGIFLVNKGETVIPARLAKKIGGRKGSRRSARR